MAIEQKFALAILKTINEDNTYAISISTKMNLPLTEAIIYLRAYCDKMEEQIRQPIKDMTINTE